MGTITEKLAYLEQTKSDIKDALIAKGVEVGDSDSFRSYASKIEDIPVGGGSFEKIVLTDSTVQYSCSCIALIPYFDYLYDCSKLTSFSYMFYNNKATSIDLSFLGGTSKVTNMRSMFYDCLNLTSLDLSSFDTSKVTDMGYMFGNCSNLTSLDLSSFDTSKVTDMTMMFSFIKLTSLDLSNWNTRNVTNMGSMFYYCQKLTSLNLSNFDTSKVTNIGGMFNGCTALTKIYCKQAFYDWCITNATTLGLNNTMKNGTVGDANEEGADYNWMIVDYVAS